MSIEAARTQEPEPLWASAGAFYVRGEYRQAMDAYRKLEEAGYRSAALYYNMGNTAYRLGNMGEAVLYLQRARHLKPNDRDIAHNLERVQEQLTDQISPLKPFFLTRWWRAAYRLVPAWLWALLGILSWLALAGYLSWKWLKGKPRRIYVVPATLGLAGWLFLSLAWSRHSWDADPGLAVILAPEAALHVAPDPESMLAKSLHEGTTVQLLDSLADWHKVRLSNGEQGWVLQAELARIP